IKLGYGEGNARIFGVHNCALYEALSQYFAKIPGHLCAVLVESAEKRLAENREPDIGHLPSLKFHSPSLPMCNVMLSSTASASACVAVRAAIEAQKSCKSTRSRRSRPSTRRPWSSRRSANARRTRAPRDRSLIAAI